MGSPAQTGIKGSVPCATGCTTPRTVTSPTTETSCATGGCCCPPGMRQLSAAPTVAARGPPDTSASTGASQRVRAPAPSRCPAAAGPGHRPIGARLPGRRGSRYHPHGDETVDLHHLLTAAEGVGAHLHKGEAFAGLRPGPAAHQDGGGRLVGADRLGELLDALGGV